MPCLVAAKLEIARYADCPLQKTSKSQIKSRGNVHGFLKDWRQPTLAEAIQPLPLARLCLTAVFGMGTGRTTALWPPNCLHGLVVLNFKRSFPKLIRRSSENYTQGHYRAHTIRELKRYSFVVSANLHSRLRLKEKAIKPHDRLVLVS
jgi:hypothetical protein